MVLHPGLVVFLVAHATPLTVRVVCQGDPASREAERPNMSRISIRAFHNLSGAFSGFPKTSGLFWDFDKSSGHFWVFPFSRAHSQFSVPDFSDNLLPWFPERTPKVLSLKEQRFQKKLDSKLFNRHASFLSTCSSLFFVLQSTRKKRLRHATP